MFCQRALLFRTGKQLVASAAVAATTTAAAVAASAAATATAVSATASAAAITAAAAVGLGLCLVNLQLATVDFFAVECRDGCVAIRLIFHFDKSETARTSGFTIFDDICRH